MVLDIRNITLSHEEMLASFECYRRMTPKFLPNCTILGGRVVSEGVVLNVKNNETQEVKEVLCKGLNVLMPVIRFCIENNIMLPRSGKKSILLEGDKVVLNVVLDLDVHLPETVDTMRIGHIKDLQKAAAPQQPNPVAN